MTQSAREFKTKDEFEAEAVRHIETTLARSLFNCDEACVKLADMKAARAMADLATVLRTLAPRWRSAIAWSSSGTRLNRDRPSLIRSESTVKSDGCLG